MPHFESAHIRDIRGGTYYDVRGDAHVQVSTGESLSGFDILHRNVAQSAFHDSSARFPQPKCHPDTREAVIKKIMTWLDKAANNGGGGGGGNSSILWLHAPAGAGKSAIGQSVAEQCCSAEPSSLAASFFFSRNIAERNTEKYLAATLAYQIAVSTPAARPFIEDAVKDDPCIFSRSLEAQFAKLIARPLVQAAVEGPSTPRWPTLILLDGLDECIGNMDGEQKQSAIIQAISTTLTRFDIPLRFLVASRPEPHIHNIFNQPDVLSISRYLKLDDSFDPDQDIETFLRAEFARICTYHPAMVSAVDWPSKRDIQCLINKSSQQFIYAATVVKFVGDSRNNPVRRLEMVLSTTTEALPSPFASIDTLYRQVLDAAQFENVDAILSIFSLVYHSPTLLTLANIAGFMALSVQDINLLLHDLHSLVDVSDFGSEVKFFHASFSDFLHNQSRAGRYYLSRGNSAAHVVQIFLKLMLDERCECIDRLACHHAYAQEYWFDLLQSAESTPALLNDLDRFLLKVSEENADPYNSNAQSGRIISGLCGELLVDSNWSFQ